MSRLVAIGKDSNNDGKIVLNVPFSVVFEISTARFLLSLYLLGLSFDDSPEHVLLSRRLNEVDAFNKGNCLVRRKHSVPDIYLVNGGTHSVIMSTKTTPCCKIGIVSS